jgi:hypothetical protein
MDLDGSRYIDMSYMGIGAVFLGYAVRMWIAPSKAVDSGSMCTLNVREVVAELLCKSTPGHRWCAMPAVAERRWRWRCVTPVPKQGVINSLLRLSRLARLVSGSQLGG